MHTSQRFLLAQLLLEPQRLRKWNHDARKTADGTEPAGESEGWAEESRGERCTERGDGDGEGEGSGEGRGKESGVGEGAGEGHADGVGERGRSPAAHHRAPQAASAPSTIRQGTMRRDVWRAPCNGDGATCSGARGGALLSGKRRTTPSAALRDLSPLRVCTAELLPPVPGADVRLTGQPGTACVHACVRFTHDMHACE